MRIVLIGAGNLATQLGLSLAEAGHEMAQVWSRSMESAAALADLVGGAAVTDLGQIETGADVYILAVKDAALPEIIPPLCHGREKGGVVVHTAGSVPMEIFEGLARHYGVLYPLQTFSKSRRVNFKEIPCFIEGNDDYAISELKRLCASLSDHVSYLASADRRYLHLSAVFACNFVNHCYDIASDILSAHQLPFDVLLPLIDETARKVHTLTPQAAQTGPAMRYDKQVIQAQAALLADMPQVRDLYERLSRNIHRNAIRG